MIRARANIVVGGRFGALLRVGLPLLVVVSLAACDDTPTSPSPSEPAPGAQPGAAPPPPPPAAAPKPVAKVSERVALTDDDFAESVERNRDPFRSYLAEFSTPIRRSVTVQRKVILPRFGLDELALIAVVTGPVRARAMFRDPTGLGVSVKRGDYISKSAGKIKQILPDKVIVEIEEQSEDRRRVADRVIELHNEEDSAVR